MYTIMIVEDDRALCMQLAEGLQKWRFNVTIAQDFEHVVAEFGRHQPQLVVMDVNLPCFDGFYWTERIRNISKVPVLFLSSRDNNMDIVMAEEDPRAVRLSIRDNGIGIRPEDQKRIFDKGFTGGNGRRTAKSTGMGLYYAKKMANKLGIGIHVRSQQNKYTEFVLSFYKLRDYYQSDMNVT